MTTSTLRHNGSFWLAAWECLLGPITIACNLSSKDLSLSFHRTLRSRPRNAFAWTYQAFFSEAALRRYIWLGQMIYCLALLFYWSGVYCGAKTAAYIESCQERQALPEPSTTTYPTTLLPAPAVSEAEITFEKIEPIPPYTSLSYQQLKDIAKRLGHSKPHMTKKADLIAFIETKIPF